MKLPSVMVFLTFSKNLGVQSWRGWHAPEPRLAYEGPSTEGFCLSGLVRIAAPFPSLRVTAPGKPLFRGAQWGTRECHGSPVMGLLSTISHGRGRPRTRMRSLGGLKRSSWWSWPWGRILRENPVLSGDCLRTELPW